MIDHARLKELEDDFGAEDLSDLIDAFLIEAQEAVDTLDELIADWSERRNREQFHFLKGCALNIGATEFAKLCESNEKSAHRLAEDDVEHVRAEFQKICDFFADDGLKRAG